MLSATLKYDINKKTDFKEDNLRKDLKKMLKYGH